MKKPLVKSRFEGIIYVFLAILIVLRFYGAYQESKHRRSAMLNPSAAPNFVWRDFESDKHEFKSLAGKVVILHFWASWCGPCRQEFPELLRAAALLKNDVVVLTISGDEDDAPAKKFIAKAKLDAGVEPDNVLYGFDAMKSVIFDTFKTTAFPESFVIDPQMRMRRKLTGMQQWEDPKLISYLKDLKAEPATAASIVPPTEVPKAP